MMDSLELIASCDLKFGKYSKLNELMKDYGLSRSSFAQLFLFRICMLCAYTRPRYQESVYRTICIAG